MLWILWGLLGVLGVVVVVGVVVKIYIRLCTTWCRSKACLVGKTVIVTGANTGIGFANALDFAMRGARVILACRDETRASKARSDIIEKTGNSNVHVKLVDLASFESVRNFAEDINATEQRLDILVNNAAIFGIGNKRTDDGRLLMIDINHYAVFLLTNLLLNLLKKSQPSRVVNVASSAAEMIFNFDLTKLDVYEGNFVTYQKSKMCNILFTQELARKLERTNVTTYSANPGPVKTDVFRHLHPIFKAFMDFGTSIFHRTCEEGTQTQLHCSLAEGIECWNGDYFSDCKRVSKFRSDSDKRNAQQLWRMSEEVVQLRPQEIQY